MFIEYLLLILKYYVKNRYINYILESIRFNVRLFNIVDVLSELK